MNGAPTTVARGDVTQALDGVPLSVFDRIDAAIRRRGARDFAPLHQGKTTFRPCGEPVARLAGFDLAAHEHARPAGAPELRRRIAEGVGARRGEDIPPDRVLVVAGATHGVGIALRALVEPGDDVLLLSPEWLFAAGLVRAALARPVEVPVFVELSADPSFDFLAEIERRVGPRTRAIYFNSPNNPTGFALDAAQLRGLAALADRHGLWLIADNAYENYDYTPHGFRDAAALAGSERTIAVHTFSKTYAMPGARIGYVVTPEAASDVLQKLSLYSVYSVATASQFAAAQALETSRDELDRRRARAAACRDLVHARLELPHTPVAGGLYTFLDLSGFGDPDAFLDACIAAGVSLAPGAAFGREYRSWARLCFTAVDEARLAQAVERLNAVGRAR